MRMALIVSYPPWLHDERFLAFYNQKKFPILQTSSSNSECTKWPPKSDLNDFQKIFAMDFIV